MRLLPSEGRFGRVPQFVRCVRRLLIQDDPLPLKQLVEGTSFCRRLTDVHLHDHDIDFRNTYSVPSVISAAWLAKSVDCILMLPKSVVDDLAGDLGLVEIQAPVPPLTVNLQLIWHRSKDMDECHQWVRQAMLETAMA